MSGMERGTDGGIGTCEIQQQQQNANSRQELLNVDCTLLSTKYPEQLKTFIRKEKIHSVTFYMKIDTKPRRR